MVDLNKAGLSIGVIQQPTQFRSILLVKKLNVIERQISTNYNQYVVNDM